MGTCVFVYVRAHRYFNKDRLSRTYGSSALQFDFFHQEYVKCQHIQILYPDTIGSWAGVLSSCHKCAAICSTVLLNVNNCVVCCLSRAWACSYVEIYTFISGYKYMYFFGTIIFKVKYLDLKNTIPVLTQNSLIFFWTYIGKYRL